jgi:hypothetical protein
MKRCPPSYAIREMQIRTKVTATHQLQQPNSKTLIPPNAGEDVHQKKLSFFAGGNVKWYSYFERLLWRFLTKVNLFCPHEAAIVLVHIYPKELKAYDHAKTYSSFIHNCQNMEATMISFSR